MEILSFDIKGKFAHFRKYYANNTAMSFSIPPRTTIMGIIAGAMGMEKEAYHLNLDSEKIRIGINVLSEIKKSFQRLNFLKIKSVSDFRGKKGHIQTPFEIVSGINPKSDFVEYRIFISPKNEGEEIFERIKKTFLQKSFIYAPSLGIANFISQLYNIQLYSENSIDYFELTKEKIDLDSACISDKVEEIFFEKSDEYMYNLIEEELMPADFISNYDRELSKMNRVLFTTANIPLSVRISGQVIKLNNNPDTQLIQFLD